MDKTNEETRKTRKSNNKKKEVTSNGYVVVVVKTNPMKVAGIIEHGYVETNPQLVPLPDSDFISELSGLISKARIIENSTCTSDPLERKVKAA